MKYEERCAVQILDLRQLLHYAALTEDMRSDLTDTSSSIRPMPILSLTRSSVYFQISLRGVAPSMIFRPYSPIKLICILLATTSNVSTGLPFKVDFDFTFFLIKDEIGTSTQ